MSAFDKRASFYQQNDITDPTPYENDAEDPVAECPICGNPIYSGEHVIKIGHDDLTDDIWVHYQCLSFAAGGYDNMLSVLAIFEDIGFEDEEVFP